MKELADLRNLFIASAYIAQVGTACVPTTSSLFHVGSLTWQLHSVDRRNVVPAAILIAGTSRST